MDRVIDVSTARGMPREQYYCPISMKCGSRRWPGLQSPSVHTYIQVFSLIISPFLTIIVFNISVSVIDVPESIIPIIYRFFYILWN